MRQGTRAGRHVITGLTGRRNSDGRTCFAKGWKNISVHSFPDTISSKWLFALRTSAVGRQSRRAVPLCCMSNSCSFTSYQLVAMWGDKILEHFGEKLLLATDCAGFDLQHRLDQSVWWSTFTPSLITDVHHSVCPIAVCKREGVDGKRQTK